MAPSEGDGQVKSKIFIGSSVGALKYAEAIRSKLKDQTDTVLWNEGVFVMMNSPLQDLLTASQSFDFAIFVFHADDDIEIRKKKQVTVRDNVLFELGLFMGSIGRERCFVVVPKDRQDLRIPTDLAGVTFGEYDSDNTNVLAAVGDACFQITQIVERMGTTRRDPERVLYSSISRFEPTDFKGIEGQIWRGDKPKSPHARGRLSFPGGGALQVNRDNTEGKFEIHLRPGGPKDPSFPKKTAVSYRRIRVRCEASCDTAPHVLEFVIKDEQKNKWLESRRVNVEPGEWRPVDLHFKIPSDVDLLFRIDDLDPKIAPSSIAVRHLVVSERD